MRWALLVLAVLLAPGLASGHGSESHPEGTHGESGAQLAPEPKPGPWPPPANASAAEGSATPPPPPAPEPAALYEPTVASPATRQWLGFKGDALRTGATLAQAPLAPERRWDAGQPGPGVLATPVVAHNLVVFAGLNRRVQAVDLATGFPQWSVELPAMALAAPAVAEDTLLVAAGNGTLVALELASGRERWRSELGARTSAAPLVVNGLVYAASEAGRVVALGLRDGSLRWSRSLPPLESLVAPTWAAGRLVVGDASGRVHALHALTGQSLWSVDIGTPVTSTPVGVGPRIVVPTLGLKALEVETGRVAWSRPAGAFVRSSPAYHLGVLAYGGADAPGVEAVNAFTGEALWAVPTRLYVRAAPTIAREHVVAAAEDGSLLAIWLRNGTVLWTLDAGERMQASPVVLDGMLLAARMDGVVRLFADPEASAAEAALPQAAPAGNGLVGLLPIFGALAAPYVVLRRLHARMLRRVEEAARAAAPAGAVAPLRGGAAGVVRVACPRCTCRFGAEPRHLSIAACPACGAKLVVRVARGARGARAAPGGAGGRREQRGL